MNWLELYKDRVMTAEQAAALIESDMHLVLTGNCSVPRTLLAALTARAYQLSSVEIVQVLTVGSADYVAPEMAGHL
ncbi:MAG: 4-hydroxybutyrate CoA-transferase, partial [Chloroflexi bacterium]|nr:4-hydroxybutyrate CoA-transferase [Chloroflexota bacterium]